MLLQEQKQQVEMYSGFISYPQSTSVLRPTLQAYWLRRESGRVYWDVVPGRQTLSPNGMSISVTVTRQMTVESTGDVVTAAFAVSQPPLPPSAAAILTPQQRVNVPTPGTGPAPTPTPVPQPTPAPSPGMASPTPVPNPPPPPAQENSGLGTAEIAGIVAGILVLAVVIVLVLFMTVFRRKRSPSSTSVASGSPQRSLRLPDEEGGEPSSSQEVQRDSEGSVHLHAMFQSAGGQLYASSCGTPYRDKKKYS
jgi:hypothetical protein